MSVDTFLPVGPKVLTRPTGRPICRQIAKRLKECRQRDTSTMSSFDRDRTKAEIYLLQQIAKRRELEVAAVYHQASRDTDLRSSMYNPDGRQGSAMTHAISEVHTFLRELTQSVVVTNGNLAR